MLIPSQLQALSNVLSSLSRRVNANSQHAAIDGYSVPKLIKKGEC